MTKVLATTRGLFTREATRRSAWARKGVRLVLRGETGDLRIDRATNERGRLAMPRSDDIPGTLERSPQKAKRTWKKTHDHAVEEYGEGERAHRTAFASLKHAFEKVGDHWEAKRRPGPSDPRSRKTTREKREGKGETFGGVDLYGHTRQELYERARRVGVRGASRMRKKELARAIARSQ